MPRIASCGRYSQFVDRAWVYNWATHRQLGIDVGPMRQQLCDRVCVTLDCGLVQGRHAMLISSIHIGSTVLQQLHELHVPLKCCEVQRCTATLQKKKNHFISSSQLRADQMPGFPWEAKLMCTLSLSMR